MVMVKSIFYLLKDDYIPLITHWLPKAVGMGLTSPLLLNRMWSTITAARCQGFEA